MSVTRRTRTSLRYGAEVKVRETYGKCLPQGPHVPSYGFPNFCYKCLNLRTMDIHFLDTVGEKDPRASVTVAEYKKMAPSRLYT